MIAVVVVTYRAPREMLESCIASVLVAGGCDRLIVIDNGGLANLSDHDVDLIVVENRGYGAAANVGFDRAVASGAQTVILLNDDIIVRSGWIEPLARQLGEGVGAVQPKLLVAGTEPPVINSLGVTLAPDGAGTDIGYGEPDRSELGSSDLEIFTGGAVALSVEFLGATGGFDERYFLYYEDVDLALRGRALGWRYRLVPESVVEHSVGASTSFRQDRTRYLQERNRLWIVFRFCSFRTIVSAIWLSLRRLRHTPRAVHWRALAVGLAGAPRRVVERTKHPRRVPDRR